MARSGSPASPAVPPATPDAPAGHGAAASPGPAGASPRSPEARTQPGEPGAETGSQATRAPAGARGPRHEPEPLSARRRWWHVAAAYGAYQAIALALWWHLLAAGIGSTLPAGSADPAQEAWFLAWLPHALGDGSNPFFSHAVFAPAGVNLLANTSADLVGLLLSPVTVTAGPVAALGVGAILGPALSATAAFALCRRYVSWQPAAFAGGLCYGFGPFLATDLRYGHLDLTWLALPPLIFLALDELLVRRRRPSVRIGVLLGALVVAQFFVSTEFLAITALMAAAAMAIGAAGWPRAVPAALRHAVPGLVAAVALASAALAYPTWVAVAGPRHITGPVWHHIGGIAASLASTVQPHGERAGVAFISGGNGSYLGVTLLAALLAGGALFRRSATLRVVLVLMVVAFLASLGYRLHASTASLGVPLPAALLAHIPLLDSIVPERFSAMTDLFAGVSLAIVVDHVRTWRPAHRLGPAHARASIPMRGAVAAGVAVVALVPLAFVPPWPYRTTPIRQPALLASGAGTAFRGIVVLYPDATSAVADEMAWQAEDGFAFSLPDGYAIVPGRGDRAVEAPRVDALWLVLAAGSVHRLRLPLTAETRGAVRADLRAVGARGLVVLPGAPGGATVRRALASALGRSGTAVDGATVWWLGARRRPTIPALRRPNE